MDRKDMMELMALKSRMHKLDSESLMTFEKCVQREILDRQIKIEFEE